MGNKGGKTGAGKPSVNVTKVTGRPIPEEAGDDRVQTLGGKRGIGQFRQGNPLEPDLPTVGRPAAADGRKILTIAGEHRFDLMEATMDASHGMVFADVFTEVDQPARSDPQPKLLEDLPADGIGQGLPMFLATTGQHQELPFVGPDAHHQQLLPAEDQGPGRGPDGRLPGTR